MQCAAWHSTLAAEAEGKHFPVWLFISGGGSKQCAAHLLQGRKVLGAGRGEEVMRN